MQSDWDQDLYGLVEQLENEGVAPRDAFLQAIQITPDLYWFARQWDQTAAKEKQAYLEDQMHAAIARIDAMREARRNGRQG